MISFQRILFPVDFSDQCAAVVPSVKAWAARCNAHVTLLHVIDVPSAGIGIAAAEGQAWATLINADRLREQGKVSLDHFASRYFPGMAITTESAEGDPATLLVDCAQTARAGLIMMPTSGRGKFRRFLLGSVTAKVLHDTATPVWTAVHADDTPDHTPDHWKSLVCALDDRTDGARVLKWTSEFASQQKLDVTLVHAVGSPNDWETTSQLRAFLLDVARERIEKLQAEAATQFRACLEVGNAGEIVRKAALAHDADLVVIGRGLIQKHFGRLRSEAYEIIRDSPSPVISV